MKVLCILLIILFLLIICSLMSIDHFQSINSLNIKYNSDNVKIPNLLEKLPQKSLSIKDEINSKLSSHPLHFEKQIYSSAKYPRVGFKTHCYSNNDCGSLTSECDHSSNVFNRELGIGACVLREPNETAFNVSY